MKKMWVLLIALLCQSAWAQDIRALSSVDKLFGLSRFWQEVNYNFAYLDKFGRDKWDEAYRAYIPKVLESKSDLEYFRELQCFCALLQDGHTNVFMPMDESNTNFGTVRLGLCNIQGRAIVGMVNLSKKDEIPLGSEVTEVNGLPTAEYIRQQVAPLISASTQAVLADLVIERLLRGVEGEAYAVKLITPDKRTLNLKLVHAKTVEKETWPTLERPAPFGWKWLDGQIAYVALNTFADAKIVDQFMTALPELLKAKGLIIDLRRNGGGSSHIADAILKRLTKRSQLIGRAGSTRQHVAAYKAWGGLYQAKDLQTGDSARGRSANEVRTYFAAAQDKLFLSLPNEPVNNDVTGPKLTPPTALLIGHGTASAAEDFLISADGQKHMIKIGEHSFGSTGQPYEFKLPGGAQARVCTIKCTYPDGRAFVGVGVKPDIEVTPTLDDYLQQKDPVLERALAVLRMRVGQD